MILGHLAFSVILVEISKLFGVNLSFTEIALVIAAGSVLDVDLIITFLFKKGVAHRNFLPHTPLGVLIIWLSFVILFYGYFSFWACILILLAFMGHLFFDDFGFWLLNSKHKGKDVITGINWLYPFKKYHIMGFIREFKDLKALLRKQKIIEEKDKDSIIINKVCEKVLIVISLILVVISYGK